jgi:protein kinase C substrate 80K-H
MPGKKQGLITATLLCISRLATCQVLGVPPSSQNLYDPILDANGEKVWKCLSDPSIVLRYDQINDDFCDCPDGSDEPGTNACPYDPSRMYYCHNEGYFPGYIETFKLNDGVCDYDTCCDGSDEYATGKCPDRCAEVNRQFQEYKTKVQQDLAKSLKIKSTLLDEAASIKRQLESKLKELQSQLTTEELELLAGKQRLIRQSSESSPQVYHALAPIIGQLSHQNTEITSTIKAQQDKINQLEGLLLKLSQEYNPNFNDLAVKESINKYKEYMSNKEDENINDHLESDLITSLIDESKKLSYDPSVMQMVEPSFSNMVHYYVGPVFEKLLKKETLSEETNTVVDESSLEELKSTIEKTKSQINSIIADLKYDFGPQDIYRSLQNKWTNAKSGEYNYRVGYFETIYQNDILIGRFAGIKDGNLIYTEGARCWNGPKRSANIEFICGSSPRILSVSEPEKCRYLIEMSSPMVCEEFTEEELRQNFKINYDLL